MKFLFDNESFSFETLRTAGFAAYGGADLGQVLTARRGRKLVARRDNPALGRQAAGHLRRPPAVPLRRRPWARPSERPGRYGVRQRMVRAVQQRQCGVQNDSRRRAPIPRRRRSQGAAPIVAGASASDARVSLPSLVGCQTAARLATYRHVGELLLPAGESLPSQASMPSGAGGAGRRDIVACRSSRQPKTARTGTRCRLPCSNPNSRTISDASVLPTPITTAAPSPGRPADPRTICAGIALSSGGGRVSARGLRRGGRRDGHGVRALKIAGMMR
jgi:hypothetical protein